MNPLLFSLYYVVSQLVYVGMNEAEGNATIYAELICREN
jgi:hypothetical protein